MRNLLSILKREKIRPVTTADVKAAPVPDQAKESRIGMMQLVLYKNVFDIAVSSGKIREELAAGALAERRSR